MSGGGRLTLLGLKVNFVLLGAEGVVESGGIVNKIGTATVALCAKMLNKPVYVGVESFKIVRFYPLNNRDIPDEFKVAPFLLCLSVASTELSLCSTSTPPSSRAGAWRASTRWSTTPTRPCSACSSPTSASCLRRPSATNLSSSISKKKRNYLEFWNLFECE